MRSIGGWRSRASTPASSRSGSTSRPICAGSASCARRLRIASPRPGLMIDANEYWSPKQAVRYVRQLEEHFDLIWVEEPARRWDYDGLRLVSQQVRAAVASGENLHNLADVYPLIANRAVDVINVWTGQSGVTGLRQIAHMAHAHGAAGLDDECAGQLHGAHRGRASQSQHDGSGRPGTRALPASGTTASRTASSSSARRRASASRSMKRSSGSCRRIRPPGGAGFRFRAARALAATSCRRAPGEVPWR